MDPRFALLLSCFFLSGFAALLYQTAWTRELSFVFGTSDLAVAAVLAAYMGGLALGAAAAARFAMRLRRPVLAYGVLELAIAACALLVPWGIRGLNALYVGLLGGVGDLPESGSAVATLFQLASAFAVLLPPTAFMGATLPLLARHAVRREEEIAARVGVLYAVNTAGAIAGTVVAAFLLMPELGLRRTVWLGAVLNALVFALAALLARRAPAPSEPSRARAPAAEGARWILPAIALSGAVSFAYEVLWTRLLGHLLGGSVHAFATMLASFLLGIAVGSAVASRLARTRERAAAGFGLTQLGIAVTSYAAFVLADQLPALGARLGAGPGSPLASAALAGAALLPITLCIGATFPFAVRVLTRHPDQAAVATARIYAWNTVGAIVGALGAGFLLLPGLGFEGALTVGVAANLALAALAALATPPRRPVLAAAAALAGLALAILPVGPPWALLSSSPLKPVSTRGEIVHYGVGRTTTVLLVDHGRGYQLTTDGLPEAWIDPVGTLPEMNVAQWLSGLPAMLRPDAREVLFVGLGGGAALELAPRTFTSLDVIELEPEVVAANRRIADLRARDPLSDPRVRVHLGDARGTLQLVNRRFDAIVSQPSHPWTAAASHLYTREFFSLVHSRLEPDGVFVQWVGIAFVDEALLRSLLAALLEAFPHVAVFRPQNYGLLFAASERPIDPLTGAARALREAPDDCARFGIHRLEDFASIWALDESGVRALAEGAPPNTDDHNLLAARSARLGDGRLDLASAAALLDPLDPLPGIEGLDLGALVRSLSGRGQPDRATELAMSAGASQEEMGLGWVELGAGRYARAARKFERALELAPESREALSGWIVTRKLEITAGRDDLPVPREQLDPRQVALIAGWRHAALHEWGAVMDLDAELARVEPGDALFYAATQLRITARLAMGDAQQAAEAETLAALLLTRVWQPYDALLHARAAIAAGQPRVALGSLQRVAQRSFAIKRGRVLAERALEVARGLPEDPPYAALRAKLVRRMRGAPLKEAAFRAPPTLR
jgi:spermidine synthase